MDPTGRFSWLLINWVTRIGAGLGGVAAVVIVGAILLDAAGVLTNPPVKAWIYLAGPGVLGAGILAVVTGLLWERRRRRRSGEAKAAASASLRNTLRLFFPDLGARQRAVGAAIVVVAAVAVLGLAGYQATSYMETAEFCGEVCHSSMAPEYHAYRESPHQRVACVRCHVGAGVKANVESKLAGLRQVWGMISGRFERPIPTPVETLRPSRETCEKCHWPAKFSGSKVKLFTHYQPDAASSPLVNVVVLKEGGFSVREKRSRGIHWHVSPDGEVRYVPLDGKRKRIGRVRAYRRGKLVAEFVPKGGGKGGGKERVMDCVDCHNRPSHIFDANAATAIDRAIDEGRIDPRLPWVRHVAVSVLERAQVSRSRARAALQEQARAAYRRLHPEVQVTAAQLDRLARGLADAYEHNVYPEMKLGFGTYESFLGHGGVPEGAKGCFRCHDDDHVDGKGRALGRECTKCHELLHVEEKPKALPDTIRSLLPYPVE